MHSFLFVRQEGRFVKLEFRNIVYIEARKNYTRAVLGNQSPVMVIGTLQQWECLLPNDLFCRIHRGFIVSIERVIAFDSKRAYLSRGEIIPIGDQYRSALADSVAIFSREPAGPPFPPGHFSDGTIVIVKSAKLAGGAPGNPCEK